MQAKYVYGSDQYVPFAMFANRGDINFSLSPYVAAPFEIDEEKFPDFDDNIPLWVKSGNSVLFSTLNYDNATLIENPILIVTNGHTGDESSVYASVATDNPTVSNPPPACPPGVAAETWSHKKFKLGVRYERTGKSEYKFCWGATIGFDNMSYGFMNKYSGGYHFANGMKVKKKDIGKLLDFDFVLLDDSKYPKTPTPLCFAVSLIYGSPATNCYAVGACEHDWYSSRKLVYTVIKYDGTPIPYKDNRKFDHEWYYLDPATNNSYDFPTRNPLPNTLYTNTNKGELQLLRWN